MKRLLSSLLVAATLLSAAACDNTGTGPAASLSGTYTMHHLGGTPLPASLVYYNAQDHIEILSARLTLNSNGTYDDVTRVQDTNYAPTTVFDDQTSGTWQLSGSRLTLYDSYDGHVTTAYVSGNDLSIDTFADYPVRADYSR